MDARASWSLANFCYWLFCYRSDNLPELKDITGNRFGRWTVIERAENYVTPSGNVFTQWLCQCDCGSSPKKVKANSLLSGKSLSCGCMQRSIAASTCGDLFRKHGEAKTRLYKIWVGMRKRCYNPNHSSYKNYGGRGISVCDEWSSYNEFKKWAESNGYSDALSIDRINVDGDYEPENCRWSTGIEQANNRRTSLVYEYDGVTHTLAEWCRLYKLDYKQTHKKVHSGKYTLAEIINSNNQ